MFKKDILLIDIESTGLDVTRHEIIQLAAILLDKKTLREKKSFTTFIKPRHWERRSAPAMAVNKIKFSQLSGAPSLKTALQRFHAAFPKNVILANYGGNHDVVFLAAAYRISKLRYPYDYHTFNMWALCYTYMALRNKLNNKKKFAGFSLEDISKHFKIPVPANRHDALADCRIEADILRHVLAKLKKDSQ